MITCRPRQAASIIKLLVLMVLMAGVMLISFGVYANWDKDANGDGQPDGFTLRVFDLEWYGMAKEKARPLANELKQRMISIKEKVVSEGGLLDKGEAWYQDLLKQEESQEAAVERAGQTDAEGVKRPEKITNKRDILQQVGEKELEDTINQAAEAAQENDPDESYMMDASDVSEKPTLHLEDDILEAGDHFKIGLAKYRSAFDEQRELRLGFEENLYISELELRKAQIKLREVLPEYAKRQDHDPLFLKRSQELLAACDELVTVSFENLPRE